MVSFHRLFIFLAPFGSGTASSNILGMHRRQDGASSLASIPDVAIICQDELPEFDYDHPLQWLWLGEHLAGTLRRRPRISQKSLLQLCATRQQGGLDRSVMGFCDYSDYFPENVTFSLTGVSPGKNADRLKAFCLAKCRCARTRAGKYPVLQIVKRKYYGLNELVPNGEDRVPTAYSRIALDRRAVPIKRDSGEEWMMIPVALNQGLIYISAVGIVDENKIDCTAGPLPLAFPSPGRPGDFATNLEACAVALSGGNVSTNAGGYCHRSADERTAHVWFTDEMTQRPEWTGASSQRPRYQDFFSLWSLRLHCYRHCFCADLRYRDNDRKSMIPFFNIVTDLHGLATGLSVANRKYLAELDALRFIQEPRMSSICRESCENSQDCVSKSSASCKYANRCAVDPSSGRPKPGGDLGDGSSTFYTVATCIQMATRPGPSVLGGRSLIEDHKKDWPCACNASVVSHACCDSVDGLIHIESDEILGQLVL